MGTLVNCKTCGALVAASARKCENCGEVLFHPSGSGGCFMVMFIVAFLV